MTDLPETIYKYRSWTNTLHKEILTDQFVYMAKPSTFEDPFDCKLDEDYESLKDIEIYNKYYSDSKVKHPHWSKREHKKWANGWFRKTPLKNKIYIANTRAYFDKEFDEKFGVLSLTANCQNIAMWEKYSDNHNGFCVGFHPKKMFPFLGGGGAVKYYDELPRIHPLAPFEEKSTIKIFSKESKWTFENEYRTHKMYEHFASNDDRKIRLSKECFKEIIFGANLSNSEKEEIMVICRNQKLDIEFKVCVIKLNTIEIVEWPSR